MSQSSLFDDDDFGFHVDGAKKIVELFDRYLSEQKNVTYPFNHIKIAAMYGQTEIIKPKNGLSIKNARMLRKHGYDVSFNTDENKWIISWK